MVSIYRANRTFIGMFLWATLVLNYLSANFFYSGEEFTRAIDTLPRELTALYVSFLPMA
jgi:tRNA(Glu) U13 pseudouridine synthase TruD